MPATPEAFLTELLDALERHTQALQAATAALNSVRVSAIFTAGREPKYSGLEELAAGLNDLTSRLEECEGIAYRLERLRQSLTQEAPRGSTDTHPAGG